MSRSNTVREVWSNLERQYSEDIALAEVLDSIDINDPSDGLNGSTNRRRLMAPYAHVYGNSSSSVTER